MSADIIITGDLNRPGQEINILRLQALLTPQIYGLTGRFPLCLTSQEPLPFDWWASGYFTGSFPRLPSHDVCIGFELPPCAKAQLPRWIDVRVHPHRWNPREPRWSVRSNMPHTEAIVNQRYKSVIASLPGPYRRWSDAAVFACQVHNDAALLLDDGGRGRFITADEVARDLVTWGRGFAVVFVCPHPLEPKGPWVGAVLERLENATPAPRGRTTYQMVRQVEHCCTLSSSVGFEAEALGATTSTFLMARPDVSPPVDIRDPELWRALLQEPPT